MFIRFERMYERDRHTNRQTDGQTRSILMNSQDVHQNCISALFFLDVSLSSFRFWVLISIFCVFYYVFNCHCIVYL